MPDTLDDFDFVPVDHQPDFGDGPVAKLGQTVPPPADVLGEQSKIRGAVSSALGADEAARALQGDMTEDEAKDFAARAGYGLIAPVAKAALPLKAIFAGVGAKTANRAALSAAENLERLGLNRDAIWNKTGWFKGVDGKWRFEIPDKNLSATSGAGGGLSGNIQHPELLAAYPQLDNLGNVTRVSPTEFPVPSGSHQLRDSDYVGRHSFIDIAAPTPQEARRTAGHELQHAVSRIEGFPPGNDPNGILDRALRTKGMTVADLAPGEKESLDQLAHDIYHRQAGETEARNVETRLNMSPSERRNLPPWTTQDVLSERQIVPTLPARAEASVEMSEPAKGIRAYHGSTTLEGPFSPHGEELGPHFGTLSQADDRVSTSHDPWNKNSVYKEGARTVPVDMQFNNPLEVRDVTYWEPQAVLNQLGKMTGDDDKRMFMPSELSPIWSNYRKWKKSAFLIDERDPAILNAMQDQVRDLLTSKGYDAIRYNNLWEGQTSKASNVAYIPLKRDTVKSAISGSTLFGAGAAAPLGYELIPVDHDPFAPGRAEGGPLPIPSEVEEMPPALSAREAPVSPSAEVTTPVAVGSLNSTPELAAANERAAAEAARAIHAAIGVLPVDTILAPIQQSAPSLLGWAAAKLAQAGTNGVAFNTVEEAQHFINVELEKAYYEKKAKTTSESPSEGENGVINRAAGGAVNTAKVTKATANYRAGSRRQRCDLCTMFRAPHGCTAVQGWIAPKGLCDYFDRKGPHAGIDNTHDVISGANSSKDPSGPVYVDHRIPEVSPKLKKRDGRPAELWKYLADHERDEAKSMRSGMAYEQAHLQATAKERAAVEADGVSWQAYTHEIDGYLAKIEHETVHNPPPNPHVDPGKAIGHHRSSNKAAGRADGGGIPAPRRDPRKTTPTPRPDPRDWTKRAIEPRAQSEDGSRGAIHPDAMMKGLGLELPEDHSVDRNTYPTINAPLNQSPLSDMPVNDYIGLRRAWEKSISTGGAVTARANGGRVDPKNINHEPTEAQKKSGVYAKDHVHIFGLPITIENARGSTRRGIGPDGKPWACVLSAHYGSIKRTEGSDGDAVDVFLGPHRKASHVFLVDQVDHKTKRFDEHKCLIGFGSEKQARMIYERAFSDGRGKDRIGAMTSMPIAVFKHWLKTCDTKKPFALAGFAQQSLNSTGFLCK